MFAAHCFPNRQRFCPRCKGRRLYLLRDHRRRCAKCRYTFNEFAGRWLDSTNFSHREWLHFLKLFEACYSTSQIAKSLNITYVTASRAGFITRQAILSQYSASVLAAQPNSVVWGITQQHSRVIVKALPDLDPDKALRLPILKTFRAGNVYTNPWQHFEDYFQTLVFRPKCQILGVADAHLSKRPLAIDRLDHFWQYARTHRLFWRQVGRTNLGPYWGEHSFRFHHRNTPLLPRLLHAICAPTPRN